MRIQVLGPIQVWRDDSLLELGPTGQRALLGLLALAGGQPLTRTEIMAGVWHEREPPPTAANVIQTYVKHLRRLLEPDRPPRARSFVLRQVGDGYALQPEDSTVDIIRFRERVHAAARSQRCGQWEHAAILLEGALALWQGPPLADLPALASHPRVVALIGERHAALARYGEVMIAAGRPAEGLSAWEEAAAAQPLNEAWQAQLIRAYHATGRRAQAFATYHETRRRLADELGVDPGPELTAAHETVLHDEGQPATATTRPQPPLASGPGTVARAASLVPAQLPPDLSDFVGRTAELSTLDCLLDGPRPSPAVVIATVSGTAGVGKTALAVRWAHQVVHRFPDGQLYVNLRGFGPARAAMDPAEAVRRFLDALDVPAERVPSDADAQAALYRSRLAGQRILVFLDNARDADQVRPLLPGGPDCLVLITSRDQLSSLVVAEGAQPLPLDLFSANDSRDLLVRRVGAERAEREPDAVADVVTWCAGLPLALAVVAARAALNRTLPLSALADQLRMTRDRLDALTTGDPGTDLRAVLSWSYRALSPRAARLFRLLGLHPGPDISTAAAASLAAVALSQIPARIAELVRANLLTEHSPGRYTCHDLLRAYAAELAHTVDRAARTHAAIRRMFDHYLHSAYAADRLVYPSREPISISPPARGVTPHHLADQPAAMAWFRGEHAVLLAVVDRAAALSHSHTWQLAWTLWTFLDRGGHWDDLAATQRAAVAAASQAGDVSAQADAHRFLARAYTRMGHLGEAHSHLQHAQELYARAGDRMGQGHTHLNLSLVWQRQGHHAEALEQAQLSLNLFQDTGNQHARARALNAVGWFHALLGEQEPALAHCRQALILFQGLDDRFGEAATWDSLGYAHHRLGQHHQALADFQQAVNLYRLLGDRHLEAMTLTHIGDTQDSLGDKQAARDTWHNALGILHDLDHRDADQVRARLARLAPAGPPELSTVAG